MALLTLSKSQIESASEQIRESHARKMAQFGSQAQKNLLAFSKYTMPEFRINWHHRLLCEYLEKLNRNEITRLMVFMPPRSGKSELVSRRFPAYLLGRNPNETIISTSYSDSLASMMNRDVQRIIDTDKFKELFPGVGLNGSNVRTNVQGSWLRNNDIFEIVNHKGRYRSAGIGSGITGLGGTTLIIDDPIKNQKEADSVTFRNAIWEWYTSTFYTRLENRGDRKGRILLTLTRWHEDDLAGRLLALARSDPKADQWTVLSFPAVKEDELNPLDPRKMGDALWPANQDHSDLEKIKAGSARIWSALYQQRPSPDKGTIVNRDWWRYYAALPQRFDRVIQSWDLSFDDGEKNAFTVGQVWGLIKGDRYLIAQVRGRMGFTAQRDAIRSLSAAYPEARQKYIEKAANGYAILESLRREVTGLIPVIPKGSKIVRAKASSACIESGNVYIPDPSIAPWINDYIEEWTAFPHGTYADQVDTTSQALLQLESKTPTDFNMISITGKSKWL